MRSPATCAGGRTAGFTAAWVTVPETSLPAMARNALAISRRACIASARTARLSNRLPPARATRGAAKSRPMAKSFSARPPAASRCCTWCCRKKSSAAQACPECAQSSRSSKKTKFSPRASRTASRICKLTGWARSPPRRARPSTTAARGRANGRGHRGHSSFTNRRSG